MGQLGTGAASFERGESHRGLEGLLLAQVPTLLASLRHSGLPSLQFEPCTEGQLEQFSFFRPCCPRRAPEIQDGGVEPCALFLRGWSWAPRQSTSGGAACPCAISGVLLACASGLCLGCQGAAGRMLGAVLCVAGQVYREPPYLGSTQASTDLDCLFKLDRTRAPEIQDRGVEPCALFLRGWSWAPRQSTSGGARVPALYQGFYWPVLPASPRSSRGGRLLMAAVLCFAG